jgi:hypothetical protein
MRSIRLLIQEHADDVYTELGEKRGISPNVVHEKGYCEPFSRSLRGRLDADNGFLAVGEELRVGENFPYLHRYVSVDTEEGQLIVDGTWQQFLDKDRRTGKLPRTVIGSREEVIELVIDAGVAVEDATALWATDNTI